jgi:poly-gamma-glutamate capsule biosynthesis protein CapA/YwtB (metallophosphatase superfamily)
VRRLQYVLGCAVLAILVAPPVAVAGGQPSTRTFTITAAGDIIPHGRLTRTGYANLAGPGWDFVPMVERISPWIAEADLAICHMEGTLSADNKGISGYPRFVGPREMASAIRAAGWDACSTASNHSLDAGWDGVVETLDVLDDNGILHAGTARTSEERLPSLYDVEGIKVAHISYTYGTNGIPTPDDRPWAVNLLDVDKILEDAAWARDHGARFTVVSIHWGREYISSPSPTQLTIARELLASDDVDLILGHHAHVVQPIERIGDKYVVYGMGNHLTNQFSRWGDPYYATEDGLMVHARVIEEEDGSFRVYRIDLTPTWVRFGDFQVTAAVDALSTGDPSSYAIGVSLQRTVSRALSLSPPGVGLAPEPWSGVTCGGRRASIVGTTGDDHIVGTDGDDVIVAGDGDDVVEAGAGDDIVCGGPGDDTIEGGPGDDRLFDGKWDDFYAELR